MHFSAGMKHKTTLAGFAFLMGCVAGCVTEPGPDAGDLPADPARDDEDDDGDGGGGGSTYGCYAGVEIEDAVARLARGGKLELDIDDAEWFSKPRSIRSSAPEILTVGQTGPGAAIVGVSPGKASIEVWRCGGRVASHEIEVVEVASLDVQLSLGLAGRSAPLTELVALPGSIDQLEVTYYDAQKVALPGRGAATFTFTGGVELAAPISAGLLDRKDGVPRETVPVAIHGPGRLTARAGSLSTTIDVTTVAAPASIRLELLDAPLFGSTTIHALEALAETADGRPIAGLAPTFTLTPADMFGQFPTNPRSSQLLLLGEAHGPVTFTAEAFGVTGSLTVTFP